MQGKHLMAGLVGATLIAGVTSAVAAPNAAATPASGTASAYNQPPKEILDVMRAPSPPMPSLSPTRDRLMLVTMEEYPSIAKVATPFLRLAGVRIEPGNQSQHDTPGGYGIPPCVSAIDLVQVADAKQIHVKLPANACPRRPVWSADGQRFAFENVTNDAVELWVGDAKTGAVRRLPGVRLNQMFGDQMQWMPDQKTLLVKLTTARKAPPAEARARKARASRNRWARRARAAPTKTATPCATATTKNCSTTTAARSWRWSMPPAARSRTSAVPACMKRSTSRRTAVTRSHRDPHAVLLRHHLRPLPQAGRHLGPDETGGQGRQGQ